MTLVPLGLYFGLLVWLFFRSRGLASFEDYSINGRTTGLWGTVWSYFVTAESAWLLLALTAAGYSMGLHALWIVLSESLFIFISWRWIGPRVQAMSTELKPKTIVDLLSLRVIGEAGIFRVAASMVLFLVIPSYVSAQLIALGKISHALFGMEESSAILVGTPVLLCFAATTSFRTMARAHIVQGALRFLGLLAVLIASFSLIRGVAAPVSWVGRGGFGGAPTLLESLGFFIVAFDLLVMPQIVLRFASARSASVISKGMIPILVIHFVSCAAAVSIGLVGRSTFPDLLDSELLFPLLTKQVGNGLFLGFVFTAVVGTIMSTVDQLLGMVGSSISWDVYRSLLDRRASDAALIRLARLVVVATGAVAFLLAQLEIQIVGLIVRYACSALAAAFGPILLLTLWERRVSDRVASASVVTGFAVTLLVGRMFIPPAGLEIVCGCVASVCVLVVGVKLSK